MFDRNSYSVECAVAGKAVTCKAYADKLVLIYDGTEVGRHVRRFTRGEAYYDWLHYLPLLARKPGALKNGIPFKDMPLPDELLVVRTHLQARPQGSRDFAHILSHIPTETLESVVSACAAAIKAGAVSKDVILNMLFRKHDEPANNHEPSNVIPMKLKIAPTADCSRYNQLLKMGA